MTTLVFESFSRPSRCSVIEPPTIVIPWVRAQSRIASTVSPSSSGSAARRSVSAEPIAFHFSGRSTRSAPVEAARATSRSAFSMLSAFSVPEFSWIAATRRRSAMGGRIACGRVANACRDPGRCAHDRRRRRVAEARPREPRRHALPPRAGLQVHSRPASWAATRSWVFRACTRSRRSRSRSTSWTSSGDRRPVPKSRARQLPPARGACGSSSESSLPRRGGSRLRPASTTSRTSARRSCTPATWPSAPWWGGPPPLPSGGGRGST